MEIEEIREKFWLLSDEITRFSFFSGKDSKPDLTGKESFDEWHLESLKPCIKKLDELGSACRDLLNTNPSLEVFYMIISTIRLINLEKNSTKTLIEQKEKELLEKS
ncbi:MAG: hypothetical protein WCO84_04585 [bacterium]